MATSSTAYAGIAQACSRQGLDQLAAAYRNASASQCQMLDEQIARQCDVDMAQVAAGRLETAGWNRLRAFQFEQQAALLALATPATAQGVAEHADRQDARRSQARRDRNADPFIRRFAYAYAAVVTVLTFAYLFWASFGPAPDSDLQSRLIDTVVGFLLGVALSTIIQFFFGSSFGSQSKGEALQQLASRRLLRQEQDQEQKEDQP